MNALLLISHSPAHQNPGMSKADIVRANAAEKKADAGIVGKIKGIFGGK